MNSDGKCAPIIISNKIKSLDMKNPGASGKNLREVLFGESIEFGTPKQTLNLLLYLLEALEHDYEEVCRMSNTKSTTMARPLPSRR